MPVDWQSSPRRIRTCRLAVRAAVMWAENAARSTARAPPAGTALASAAVKAGLLKVLGGRGDQIHFEVRLYRHRARQSGLIEAAWDMSNR